MVEIIENCTEWILAALEYSGGTHDFIHVVEGIKAGTMPLCPTLRGCIVSEIVVYPKVKQLNIFLGGGELDQIMAMHTDVIKWAKAQGCSALTMTGLAGWKIPLSEHRWYQLHSSYTKELTYRQAEKVAHPLQK